MERKAYIRLRESISRTEIHFNIFLRLNTVILHGFPVIGARTTFQSPVTQPMAKIYYFLLIEKNSELYRNRGENTIKSAIINEANCFFFSCSRFLFVLPRWLLRVRKANKQEFFHRFSKVIEFVL